MAGNLGDALVCSRGLFLAFRYLMTVLALMVYLILWRFAPVWLKRAGWSPLRWSLDVAEISRTDGGWTDGEFILAAARWGLGGSYTSCGISTDDGLQLAGEGGILASPVSPSKVSQTTPQNNALATV